MREILFRGRRVDNGEWETGSLVYARMGTSEEQVSIADKMTAYHTPVIPETVGQYTGLKDVHNTRVFEGDIVKWDEKEWGRPYNELVEFDYDLLAMRKSDYEQIY